MFVVLKQEPLNCADLKRLCSSWTPEYPLTSKPDLLFLCTLTIFMGHAKPSPSVLSREVFVPCAQLVRGRIVYKQHSGTASTPGLTSTVKQTWFQIVGQTISFLSLVHGSYVKRDSSEHHISLPRSSPFPFSVPNLKSLFHYIPRYYFDIHGSSRRRRHVSPI